MTRLNVRCCCQPKKILGTYPVPDGVRALRVPIMETDGIHVEELEVRQIEEYGRREWAIYSEERPIEFWRKLPGFEEAA